MPLPVMLPITEVNARPIMAPPASTSALPIIRPTIGMAGAIAMPIIGRIGVSQELMRFAPVLRSKPPRVGGAAAGMPITGGPAAGERRLIPPTTAPARLIG